MQSGKYRPTAWISALSLVSLVILAIFDLSSSESVPTIVYATIGGIALGVGEEFLPYIFGGRKNDK